MSRTLNATIEDEDPLKLAESWSFLQWSAFLGSVTIKSGADCAGNSILARWEREPDVDPVLEVYLRPSWESSTGVLIPVTLTELLSELVSDVREYLASDANPREANGQLKKDK
jgi:hypothetical protein